MSVSIWTHFAYNIDSDSENKMALYSNYAKRNIALQTVVTNGLVHNVTSHLVEAFIQNPWQWSVLICCAEVPCGNQTCSSVSALQLHGPSTFAQLGCIVARVNVGPPEQKLRWLIKFVYSCISLILYVQLGVSPRSQSAKQDDSRNTSTNSCHVPAL